MKSKTKTIYLTSKKKKEAKFHRRNLNGKTEKNELTREIKGVWKS